MGSEEKEQGCRVLSKRAPLYAHVNIQAQSQVHAVCHIYNVVQTMSH